MTRVAAVDCGTNSIRLLVTDLDAARGSQQDLDRRMEIVRLGQGVDRTGQLAPEALARTDAALQRYATIVESHGVSAIRVVATSATRDASNREEFSAAVLRHLGVAPDVVTGDDEARLAFSGATRGLPSSTAAPYLVVDIGGGSTELVRGIKKPDAAISLDIGSVRLTERRFAADPPAAEQIAAATADIDAALSRPAAVAACAAPGAVVGVAGTITTVAAIHLGLTEYDPGAIHHSRLPATRIAEISDWLLHASHAERAANPAIHPGRVDVIGAGALVLRRVVERSGAAEVVVSEHDILDGIAWSLAQPR